MNRQAKFVAPLPASTNQALTGCQQRNEIHPGLFLDKYVPTWNLDNPTDAGQEIVQKPAIERLVQLSDALSKGLDFKSLSKRYQAITRRENTQSFQAKLISPLALHLARASALENASVCLHPIYGFAYIPGSGLKGMAHAYAVTVWLPTQPDEKDAWRKIDDVFGWTNTKERRDRLKANPQLVRRRDDNDVQSPELKECTGSVVIHDAWPIAWPRLICDIVNCHHSDYYGAPEGKVPPPGDWENPNPVYFAAIAPQTSFEFAVSPRRSHLNDFKQHVGLASEWLAGGLYHFGAGAKTAAGYGNFEITRTAKVSLAQKVVKLELVTPAFLGGHDRNAERVTRLPSLKAWLRQWWRAWHGHLPADDLRREEARVFGSIDTGTKLRLSHAGCNLLKVLPRDQDFGGGGSPLGYLAYGPVAYERDKRTNRTQVDALAPDQTLQFRLNHPAGEDALNEALKSLWLGCALSGVGSRNRRAWGSLLMAKDESVLGLPNLCSPRTLEEYRQALHLGLERLAPTANRPSASATCWTALSLETRIVLSRAIFSNWRAAMEDLGRKFIAFRGRDKRGDSQAAPGPDYIKTKAQLRGEQPDDTTVPERAAFGMPYAQAFSSLPKAHFKSRKYPTATFTPIWPDGSRIVEGRRASSLFCKIVRLATGEFFWQVAFLPAQFLPIGANVRGERTDIDPKRPLPVATFVSPSPLGVARTDSSRTLLTDFLDWLEGKPIAQSAARLNSVSVGDSGRPSTKATQIRVVAPKPVNAGQERIDGTLRRKDHSWVVVFPGDEREAEIVNPEKLPADISEAIRCEFRVMQQSKQAGITVRFNRVLKGR